MSWSTHKMPVAALAVAAAMFSSPLVFAQSTTPSPSPAATASPPVAQSAVTSNSAGTTSLPAYETTGFRSAHFGMTDSEVRAAIKADLGASVDVKASTNSIERTTLLSATVPSLEPGPGPATVVYIFGYKSKKLIQVNVIWAGATVGAEAQPFVVAGVQLATYFKTFSWKDGKIIVGVPAGPNGVVMFAAEDQKTGLVQVTVDGVAFEKQVDGKTEAGPKPTTPPILRLAYVADGRNPDVFHLEQGRF
jgi:hypothetical protein